MWNVEKKVLGKLTKCYSLAKLKYKGREHILVAAEKVDACYLLDSQGNREDIVWTKPGGVMSMVPVPGQNGQFLATHQFYSPNDSQNAKIVIATPHDNDKWEVRTLVNLPFVHRFDILERGGVNYLIACTLKSGHQYKDDWSSPGKVYAAVLPDDLNQFSEENQLELSVIQENMLKNHGYTRFEQEGIAGALISAEQGVYQFFPPEYAEGKWTIKKLLDKPCSDAVLVDFDGDLKKELAVISPFHGNQIAVYKEMNGKFQLAYEYTHAEFAHAIYGGMICGRPALIIGCRGGDKALLAFTWDKEQKCFEVQTLDQGCGSANVMLFRKNKEDFLVSANREIDEIAMYQLRDKENIQ